MTTGKIQDVRQNKVHRRLYVLPIPVVAPVSLLSKRCPKCKRIKSVSEFYKRKESKDGLQSHCKSCQKVLHSNYQKTEKGKIADKSYAQGEEGKAAKKRYAQSEKGKAADKRYNQSEKGKTNLQAKTKRFVARYPNHLKAKRAVNNAISASRLPKPDTLQCHYCPAKAKQYHHWHGYEPEHWLDVIPVCTQCHQKCKRKIA